MAVEATKYGDGDRIKFTASADLDPGDVVQKGGLAAIVAGLKKTLNGEEATGMVKGQYDVACASGTTFSEGATVQWDDTNKLAVASGDFTLGKAVKAKVSGETTVRVMLNE